MPRTRRLRGGGKRNNTRILFWSLSGLRINWSSTRVPTTISNKWAFHTNAHAKLYAVRACARPPEGNCSGGPRRSLATHGTRTTAPRGRRPPTPCTGMAGRALAPTAPYLRGEQGGSAPRQSDANEARQGEADQTVGRRR